MTMWIEVSRETRQDVKSCKIARNTRLIFAPLSVQDSEQCQLVSNSRYRVKSIGKTILGMATEQVSFAFRQYPTSAPKYLVPGQSKSEKNKAS
mmetsp:Transcript_152/g.328  ORF Transcript_152/g.328 Transcript_152/m.328 type:complete len:93 (-) Transcript_152:970-1248(-)